MGGEGSGQPVGCGMGKGQCGDCEELKRRGPRGHWNYYCTISGRRVNRMKSCPKDPDYVPFKRSISKKVEAVQDEPKIYEWRKVLDPAPGIRVMWEKMEVTV